MPVYSRAHNTKKETKQCKSCLVSLPNSATYFYRMRVDKKVVKTLRDICKDCTPATSRKRNKIEDVLNKYVVGDNGCWVYTGGKDRLGYGNFYYQQSAYKAHRLSYQLLVGQIPDGLVLDHLCRNKSCINPEHLEVVTQGENAKRWFNDMHCRGCSCEVV